ncbi:hypothetical protein J3459_008347 [Metarhizium acridum]|nr:hypothetical protein J3459_008347 [Metarhizium acridum]
MSCRILPWNKTSLSWQSYQRVRNVTRLERPIQASMVSTSNPESLIHLDWVWTWACKAFTHQTRLTLLTISLAKHCLATTMVIPRSVPHSTMTVNLLGPPAPADAPEQSNDALGVPQQQMKRLSVGFRPLPPDEVMESEDPEYRANRIRSFYKEYFDDREPAPPLPGTEAAEYYEDYDAGYLGDAAYYDAETNAFVMPYAQPVTRRAMTPPPAGRFRGGPGGPGPRGDPRGPVRGPHGSIGGMSLPGGQRRPRAGSAFGPRPGSSASAQMRGRPPKKNLPPPSALHTLPTPSKLKDDSFAIFNATDFAPPDSFREHVAGRSQSPLGERRAYSPKVPVASPLVTSFDELSVLPSPHMLRKSSTFTGLDFAPPKKFKDADTMSDAGSIRSNTSGISAAQLHAIRGGAGRVSRLPGDTVFTSAALEGTLKPQWGMRP